jgi:hypothetical protein
VATRVECEGGVATRVECEGGWLLGESVRVMVGWLLGWCES